MYAVQFHWSSEITNRRFIKMRLFFFGRNKDETLVLSAVCFECSNKLGEPRLILLLVIEDYAHFIL